MSKIIDTVKSIHQKHKTVGGSVSEQTKNAQFITKKWQEIVCSDNIKSEVNVSPNSNEKIDIIDFTEMIAYELKVSGKNPHHEFYKDLIKVLTFNTYQEENYKIKQFTFITEEVGISKLVKRLDDNFVKLIKDKHKLEITLIRIPSYFP